MTLPQTQVRIPFRLIGGFAAKFSQMVVLNKLQGTLHWL